MFSKKIHQTMLLRPIAHDARSSASKLLVPESGTINLGPSFAHQIHKKLVPECMADWQIFWYVILAPVTWTLYLGRVP